MIQREPLKILAAIIQHEMGLADGQVMVVNQKWPVPTKGLYVTLKYISGRAIGRSNRQVDSPEGLTEVLDVNMSELIQVDVMSPGEDPAARVRKEEVLQALGSIFSEQMQTQYGLQIAQLPMDMLNADSLEEPGMLNRFTTTIRITTRYRSQKATGDYYDKFEGVKVTTVDSETLADAHTVEVTPNA